jgi:non-specific serine/threonine protein kinase
LLTLTGPGGVGKTRLGLTIARDVSGHFAEGVVWVDLAAVTDPALLPTAIATALALTPAADRSILEELGRHLQTRCTVLLLDNCEHLLTDVADLVAVLLAHCPVLQVMATSRAPLRIRGEQVLPVEPLTVPAAGVASFDTLASSDAIRLFTERSRAVQPAFTFDYVTLRTVAEVCRQLDGLPLAIELAAARTTILPPRALLAQMHDRLRWLSDGPRDLPARQRTVRDTIAWSYELLDDQERQLFRRLAVFVGGFTMDAVERVVDHLDGAGSEVVAGVSGLVDQGLVRRVGADDQPRFMLLETIREFGQEQMVASGEADAVRTAHAICFLEFAERHHPNRVQGQERVDARLRRIEAELANIRAALAWFRDRGDARHLLRMAAALAVFWHLRTHLQEGRYWLERALSAVSDPPALPHGQALAGLALILWAQSHYERATAMAEASLARAEQLGDVELAANALHVLGMVAEIQDQWDEAGDYLTRACEHWRALGAKADEAWALTLLCRVALGQGDRPLAALHAQQALTLFREVGHPAGIATALSRLAEIARGQGNDQRAAVAFHEALEIWSAIGDRWLITLAIAGLADLAAGHGQAPAAATLVGFIDALEDETGAPLLSAARLCRDRAMLGASAHLDETQWAASYAAGRTVSLGDAVVIAAAVDVPDRVQGSPLSLAALTARELEVLRLMAGMRTDQEIATVLSLSRRTVSGHVGHILTKLGVLNRRAAVIRGRELGLLADSEQ